MTRSPPHLSRKPPYLRRPPNAPSAVRRDWMAPRVFSAFKAPHGSLGPAALEHGCQHGHQRQQSNIAVVVAVAAVARAKLARMFAFLMWPASVTERLEAASSLDGLKPAACIGWLKASSTHLLPLDMAPILPSSIPPLLIVCRGARRSLLWNDIQASGLTLTPKLL